ncbi:MAG: acetyl-CoA carboxylase, carboxyltransferase subunit beta [Defluviitaleaceae bacterium]|nr:acetyl-CoA carboxylase, carboxyltransferase subunit beta [Defluviitaleaceae bacterium]
MNLFKKKYVTINTDSHASASRQAVPTIPDGVWHQCGNCGRTVYKKEIGVHKVCPKCSGCFRLTALERVALTADEGSYLECDADLAGGNPLDFPGYSEKLASLREATGINDAIVCGKCTVDGFECYVGSMDPTFIMGSMGSVVGEKLTRMFENATRDGLPAVVFTVSGGARMQEGIISLMQMAKVSAAVARHSEAGLLYVTVLTDPTTGGVTASFAMLGDVILAEPGTVVGFAGRRVIESTIKQSLPDDFQTAEFVLQHGFIDAVVPREKLKATLSKLFMLHGVKRVSVADGDERPAEVAQ